MRTSLRFCLLFVLITNCFSLNAQGEWNLPSPESILKSMETANDYFIAKYPDPGKDTFVKKVRPSNLWTRGVYFEGLYALTDIEQKTGGEKYDKYHKYIYDWGTAHKWTPRNGITTRDADDYCCSQTYLDMYMTNDIYGKATEHKERINPTIKLAENLLSIEKSRGDWTWIDAIQMGLPVFAKLSRITYLAGNETDAVRYMEKGWEMYECSRNEIGQYTRSTDNKTATGLYNQAEGLWWRDKDFVPPYKEPNGEDCYWSRGNGWVYAALVRVMDAMLISKQAQAPGFDEPSGKNKWKKIKGISKRYKAYEKDFKAMTEALRKCQRSDHFWNVSLHDESNFGGKELTGTALFIYGMAWGVRHGILPEKVYMPIISETWKAMVKECLHSNGFLGYVQGTGKEPKDSQPVGYNNEPDFDDYGLGCFLLAGSEIYKLSVLE